jgi:hypothetical protein
LIFLGRRYRILERDLCDGHVLSLSEPGLSVRHKYAPLCCIRHSIG